MTTPTALTADDSPERADYIFLVKETGDGRPYLLLQPDGTPGLSCVGDGQLTLTLQESATYEDARDLASRLNWKIHRVVHTKPSAVSAEAL